MITINNIKTTNKELLALAKKGMNHIIKSKVTSCIKIEKDIDPDITIRITFFGLKDNFTLALYNFRDLEKNQNIMDKAIQIMKGKISLEDEIKVRK